MDRKAVRESLGRIESVVEKETIHLRREQDALTEKGKTDSDLSSMIGFMNSLHGMVEAAKGEAGDPKAEVKEQ